MRARHAFFLTPGPPNLRAIGAMARRRQSKHGEGRVRGRGYSRRGHGPGERERAHFSRWCVSAPQAAGEGARRARVPGGAQPGRSLGRGAKSAPRLVSAVLAAPAVAGPTSCARAAAMRLRISPRPGERGRVLPRLRLSRQMEFLGKSHLRLGGGRDWLMLEILVARVEVVPKVIPLIIIHKPVVALARHTRALHGTRVRVFGMDGERQEKEAGRKEARFRSTTLDDDEIEERGRPRKLGRVG